MPLYSPDIVNLVEVNNKKALDRVVQHLHARGFKHYKGYHIESDDTGTRHDVSLISKLRPDQRQGKFIRKRFSEMRGQPWRADYTYKTSTGQIRTKHTSISRNAIYCFTVGTHKLGFLGLHLKSNPASAKANGQRTGQSKVAQQIIRKVLVEEGYTPIVLGDINDFDDRIEDADPHQDTKTKVLANLRNYDHAQPGDEMVNVAKFIPKQLRYTAHYDKDKEGDYDADEPFTMLDHILVHKSLAPKIRRVFIDHGHGHDISDHWPVVIDLAFE